MCGDAALRDVRVVRMLMRIEAIGEEALDCIAAEFTGRQRDPMDYDEADAGAVGSRIAVRRPDLARQIGIAAFVDGEVSARGAHGGQCYPEQAFAA